MASVTATAKPEAAGRRFWRLGLQPSRIGRLIVVLNLIALAVLIGGVLLLSELRQGLVNARLDSLRTEGQLIANVIDKAATIGDPEPQLEADAASDILQSLAIPRSERVRLFSSEGQAIVDSYVASDRVESAPLPPPRPSGSEAPQPSAAPAPHASSAAQAALAHEVAGALAGDTVGSVRPGETGGKVVSVSIPLEHVRDVVGVLTLEAGDVDQIIANERAALIPFIVIAVLVNIGTSIALTWLVVQPLRRLSAAADSVRLARARAITLPDIAARRDEVGDLARSLEYMSHSLSDRMEAIERFAADVAHEIRNPLTSVRSAVETLELAPAPAAREKLLGILKQDVSRLDRLITDISNASRLDAELGREDPKSVALTRLLRDIVGLYETVRRGGEPHVSLEADEAEVTVMGWEGPLGQVVRNLVDNARSFSPRDGEVRVSLARERGQAVIRVDDDGPGMPPDNLETVFQRFYTSRPKGAAFGGASGLGLSIARQIVEAHSGTIHAENRKGPGGKVVGARFVVSLPQPRATSRTQT